MKSGSLSTCAFDRFLQPSSKSANLVTESAAMVSMRDARKEDIPVLHEFNTRLARETENGMELDPETLKLGLEAVLADASLSRYFVAVEEQGQEVVGCCAVTFEFSDWRNGVVWWLQSVYVKEGYRKKGIFRLMFDHVMKQVHDDPSIKGLRLNANSKNSAAIKVYKNMGMDGEHLRTFELMKDSGGF